MCVLSVCVCDLNHSQVSYLRGVHMARKSGKLDWNKLNLCTIDTLTVMLPEGDAALISVLNVTQLFFTLTVMLPEGDATLIQER